MKCFPYLKEKIRSKQQRSAPISKTQNHSSTSNVSTSGRVTQSSSSTISSRGMPELFEEKAQNLRIFSFSELRRATNDFSRLLKIGEGGFGTVYKGTIKPVDGRGDRIVVAIKKLNKDGFQVGLVLHISNSLFPLTADFRMLVITF